MLSSKMQAKISSLKNQKTWRAWSSSTSLHSVWRPLTPDRLCSMKHTCTKQHECKTSGAIAVQNITFYFIFSCFQENRWDGSKHRSRQPIMRIDFVLTWQKLDSLVIWRNLSFCTYNFETAEEKFKLLINLVDLRKQVISYESLKLSA